jgi:hypothetical protein
MADPPVPPAARDKKPIDPASRVDGEIDDPDEAEAVAERIEDAFNR